MKTVIITKDIEWGEYQVQFADGTYHTDDRQDAIDTARAALGPDVKIVHRTKRMPE